LFTITQAYSLQSLSQRTQGDALGFYKPALQAEKKKIGLGHAHGPWARRTYFDIMVKLQKFFKSTP